MFNAPSTAATDEPLLDEGIAVAAAVLDARGLQSQYSAK